MIETEFFQGRSVDEVRRKTVAPYWAIILAVLLGVALAMLPIYGHADPRFMVQDQNVKVILYDEPCELKEVSNLPYKATWEEGGQVYQGCAAPRPDHQLVVVYFSDKTVALIPFSVLRKLTGA